MIKRIFITVLFIFSLTSFSFAVELDNVKEPKNPAYRVGTTDDIEKEYKVKDLIKQKKVKNKKNDDLNTAGLTYADLSIKKISLEISKDLQMESEDTMGDLSMLWQGAAVKSDTIKFAIYKLSNPDAAKPDDKSVKNVLMTIANMSTLIGAGSGNPLLATGSFFTSSVMGIMGQDTKALNYKYTKVNDADMIILVRKIEDLQQNIINRYYDYMTARKTLAMVSKMVKERQNNYKFAQNKKDEHLLISDAYYRDSLDMQMKAKNEFYSKRAALEQLVGSDIFKQFEDTLNQREKKNNL